MPGTRQEFLLAGICRFFSFSERAYRGGVSSLEPLLDVAACWEYWWRGELDRDQRTEIQEAAGSLTDAALGDFLLELRRDLAARFGSLAAAEGVLLQLPAVKIFAGWRAAVEAQVGCLKTCNFVAVPAAPGGASPGEVIPVGVFLRPKKRDGDFITCASNMTVDGGGAALTRQAVISLLKGRGLVLLTVFGGFACWTTARRCLRVVSLVGWLTMAAGLGTVLSLGAWLAHESAVAILAACCALVLLLVPAPLFGLIREGAWARRLGEILAERQVCIVSGRAGRGAPLALRGYSYTLALAVAMLAALLDEERLPRGSWLWGRFVDAWTRTARNRAWVFTGVLRGNARIDRVREDLLAAKHKVCLLTPGVTSLAIPVQNPQLPPATPKPSSSPRGDPPDVLCVHRFRHLATVVLRLGKSLSPAAMIASTAAFVSILALTLAIPDLCRILLPPRDPQLILWKCEEVSSPTGLKTFRIVVAAQSPHAFQARLTGGAASEARSEFQPDSIHEASAELRLSSWTGSGPDTPPRMFELVWTPRFLGRGLREVVVLREHYEALKKDAESERLRLMKLR